MQHFRHLNEANLTDTTIVTVGVFDGVHRGHQTLLKRLAAQSHEHGHQAGVLTFFPHPDVVLRGIEGRYYLTSPEERARLIGKTGIDVVVTHPFDDSVRQIRAADFVDQLISHLRMVGFRATADFALGYKREGNIEFLRQQGAQKGFTVETFDLITDDDGGDVVRSARIREALSVGTVAQATQLLGRPYRVSGEVVKGDQRGRKIGFPTANTAVWELQLLPANGVYACQVYLDGEQFDAVTNIGKRPTFDGTAVTVEAHILDFDRDIYGQQLQIDFIERLRGEIKFSGIDALIERIQIDVENGREILKMR